jgi:hypothetical protein
MAETLIGNGFSNCRLRLSTCGENWLIFALVSNRRVWAPPGGDHQCAERAQSAPENDSVGDRADHSICVPVPECRRPVR